MARRKRSRIPGPKIWALAAALVLAGYIFGSDDLQMRRTFFDMAEGHLHGEAGSDQGPQETVARGARIIDGDKLDMNGTRIRLYGIDALESAQTCRQGARSWNCGQEAKAALVKMIGDQPLSCKAKDQDRYGRTVAMCEVGGVGVTLGWFATVGPSPIASMAARSMTRMKTQPSGTSSGSGAGPSRCHGTGGKRTDCAAMTPSDVLGGPPRQPSASMDVS